MIWDADCGFCRRWVRRFDRWTGGEVAFARMQEIGDRFPPLGEEQFRTAVYLIEPDGSYSRGAEAVFRALDIARTLSLPIALYESLPFFAVLCETAYFWVAHNRRRLSRLGL